MKQRDAATGARWSAAVACPGALQESGVVSRRMGTHRSKAVKSVALTGSAPTAVLYARVSSKQQEQGYSIPAQQELRRQYAARTNLAIVKEFVDVESAKSSGRSGFLAMIEYLREHPGCRVVLAEKTDRLYRNLKDYVTLDELDVEIHMVKENEILSK